MWGNNVGKFYMLSVIRQRFWGGCLCLLALRYQVAGQWDFLRDFGPYWRCITYPLTLSTASQRCCVGLRSGDCGGHFSAAPCSCNQLEMVRALWRVELCCWKWPSEDVSLWPWRDGCGLHLYSGRLRHLNNAQLVLGGPKCAKNIPPHRYTTSISLNHCSSWMLMQKSRLEWLFELLLALHLLHQAWPFNKAGLPKEPPLSRWCHLSSFKMVVCCLLNHLSSPLWCSIRTSAAPIDHVYLLPCDWPIIFCINKCT